MAEADEERLVCEILKIAPRFAAKALEQGDAGRPSFLELGTPSGRIKPYVRRKCFRIISAIRRTKSSLRGLPFLPSAIKNS